MEKEPWRANVGKTIRYYRKKKGLTSRQASEKYDCAERTWAQMEAGTENLSLDTLQKISRVLGVPAWRLLQKPNQRS